MKIPLTILGLLAVSFLRAAEPPVIDIPKLTSSPWLQDAYRAEVLTPARPPAGRVRSLALGWNDEGLLVHVESPDDTPSESPGEKDLWTGDSVEIFVASAPGSKDRFQLVASPGRPSGSPRFSVVDEREEKPSAGVKPAVTSFNNDGSFTMGVRIPWSSFLTPPKPGDVIGVQVYVNDRGVAGNSTRQIWYPKVAMPALMYPVRLAEKASPPQTEVAFLNIERVRNVALDVISTAAHAGEPVEIEIEGRRVQPGLLELANIAEARAHFVLPADIASKAGARLRISVAGRELAGDFVIPDLAEAQRRLLARTRVVAASPVFSSPQLPAVNFEDRELAEAAFGSCEFVTRYFDADLNEVKQAEKPGRYGALTTIRTSDGIEDTRRVTLFKTAKPYSSRLDVFDVRLGLPAVFGLPEDVTQKEDSMVQAFVNYGLRSRVDDLGPFLAALHDISADPAKLHGLDYGNVDIDWWRRLDRKLGLAQPYKYLLDLPRDYDADPKKAWPLLLFLHGSGERGTDVNAVARHGPPKLIRNGKDLPFIVVSPQCPPNQWWSSEALAELLDTLAQKFRVDPARVYVTGLSMGGYGTWALAGSQPERFAAIAPICGGAFPELAPRVKKIPTWVFHGDKDEAVPIGKSEGIVAALKKLKAPVKFTVYPGVGHDSWTQTYENPEFFTWLLQQSRPTL